MCNKEILQLLQTFSFCYVFLYEMYAKCTTVSLKYCSTVVVHNRDIFRMTLAVVIANKTVIC